MTANARDVIARALWHISFPDKDRASMEGTVFLDERAPIIIAALTAAGYEIVQRDAPLPPPGPSNIIVTQPSPLPAPKRVDDQ